MIKFKKGDKIDLSNPPKVELGDYKIVWEPDEQSTQKDTDYSEYINLSTLRRIKKENKK